MFHRSWGLMIVQQNISHPASCSTSPPSDDSSANCFHTTTLYRQMTAEGRMLEDVDLADIHGQFKFNFQHAAISRDQSKHFSMMRSARTSAATAPVCFVSARRFSTDGSDTQTIPNRECANGLRTRAHKLRTTYNAALWAMEKRLQQSSPEVAARRKYPWAEPGELPFH
jgi:hypothetical protein